MADASQSELLAPVGWHIIYAYEIIKVKRVRWIYLNFSFKEIDEES